MRKVLFVFAFLFSFSFLMAQGHQETWHPSKVILKSESFSQETTADVIAFIDDLEGVVTLKVKKDGIITPIRMEIRDIQIPDSTTIKYKLDPKGMLVTAMTEEGEMCKLTVYNADLSAVWRKVIFLFYL